MSASPFAARFATRRLINGIAGGRGGHKGAVMRTTALITLALVAGFAAAPTGVRAQSNPNELPCVGYATFDRHDASTELIGLHSATYPPGRKSL